MLYVLCMCVRVYMLTSVYRCVWTCQHILCCSYSSPCSKPVGVKSMWTLPFMTLLLTSLSASCWHDHLLSYPYLPQNWAAWASALTRGRRNRKSHDWKHEYINPVNSRGTTITRLHESTWTPMGISQRCHLQNLAHRWFARSYSSGDRSQQNQASMARGGSNTTILRLLWASKPEERGAQMMWVECKHWAEVQRTMGDMSFLVYLFNNTEYL